MKFLPRRPKHQSGHDHYSSYRAIKKRVQSAKWRIRGVKAGRSFLDYVEIPDAKKSAAWIGKRVAKESELLPDSDLAEETVPARGRRGRFGLSVRRSTKRINGELHIGERSSSIRPNSRKMAARLVDFQELQTGGRLMWDLEKELDLITETSANRALRAKEALNPKAKPHKERGYRGGRGRRASVAFSDVNSEFDGHGHGGHMRGLGHGHGGNANTHSQARLPSSSGAGASAASGHSSGAGDGRVDGGDGNADSLAFGLGQVPEGGGVHIGDSGESGLEDENEPFFLSHQEHAGGGTKMGSRSSTHTQFAHGVDGADDRHNGAEDDVRASSHHQHQATSRVRGVATGIHGQKIPAYVLYTSKKNKPSKDPKKQARQEQNRQIVLRLMRKHARDNASDRRMQNQALKIDIQGDKSKEDIKKEKEQLKARIDKLVDVMIRTHENADLNPAAQLAITFREFNETEAKANDTLMNVLEEQDFNRPMNYVLKSKAFPLEEDNEGHFDLSKDLQAMRVGAERLRIAQQIHNLQSTWWWGPLLKKAYENGQKPTGQQAKFLSVLRE